MTRGCPSLMRPNLQSLVPETYCQYNNIFNLGLNSKIAPLKQYQLMYSNVPIWRRTTMFVRIR